VIASGFDDKFKRLPARVRSAVKGYIRWEPRRPRVTLPKV
jgi:hypothetical protein